MAQTDRRQTRPDISENSRVLAKRSKRSSHLSLHAVMTLPESLTPLLRGAVLSHLRPSQSEANRERESRKPAMIKLIHIEPGCLFVCTLGPQPDKLIITQNITCCPICSDPVLSQCPC